MAITDFSVFQWYSQFKKKKLLEGRIYKLQHIKTVILYVAETSKYCIIMRLRVIFINLKWRCIWFPPFLYKPLWVFLENIIRITKFALIQKLLDTFNIYGRGCKLAVLEWIWLTYVLFDLYSIGKTRFGSAFYSNDWLELNSICTLLTRNVVSSLSQFPLLPIVYPTIRPNVGYHVIVLVLLFFLYLVLLFTYDAS